MVKRRVRHTSSAVGRPAGTGAHSHWSSSGAQREEEGGETKKERAGEERKGRTEGGRGVKRDRERQREREGESEVRNGELLVGDYLLKESNGERKRAGKPKR